jgi:hypothetical protein
LRGHRASRLGSAPLRSETPDQRIWIDESDEQSKNAHDSTRESFEPGSNVTLDKTAFSEQHPQHNSSISHPITIEAALPKYLIIDVPSKFIRKSSLILKCEFPSSTQIAVRFVKAKACGTISDTVAGMQIDESDEQKKNASDSICKSLEPRSNTTLKSALHEWKHASPMT